jgi:hypothetical protein
VTRRPITPLGGALLAALAVGLLAVIYARPSVLLPVAGLVVLGGILGADERRRLRRLAAERRGESVCTFARSFDLRVTDPRVVRAVYEEIQSYYAGSVERLPVRATDRIEEDLRLDWDDLDDLARDVAARAGRLMDQPERNPFYGRVRTVWDLVLFLDYQPRRAAA